MKTMNRFGMMFALALGGVLGLRDAAADTTNLLYMATFDSPADTNAWVNEGGRFIMSVVGEDLKLQQNSASNGKIYPQAATNYWNGLNTNVALSFGFSFDNIRTNGAAASNYNAYVDWAGSNYANLVRLTFLQQSSQDTVVLYSRNAGGSWNKTLFSVNTSAFNSPGATNHYTGVFETNGFRLILQKNSNAIFTNVFFAYDNINYFQAGTTAKMFGNGTELWDGALQMGGDWATRANDQIFFYDNVGVFQIIPVPEPAALAALTLGIGVLGWLGRRRA